MAKIKVPQNQILFNYTSGGEYIVEKTYQNYIGHYYEFKGKTYAGKEYNFQASVLIKVDSDKVNKLIINPKTATYGIVSGMKLHPTSIPAYNYIPLEEDYNRGYVTRYFAKKQNTAPNIIIREISEDTFNEYKDNPNYQLISITFDFVPKEYLVPRDINKVETEMPGIKTFLSL